MIKECLYIQHNISVSLTQTIIICHKIDVRTCMYQLLDQENDITIIEAWKSVKWGNILNNENVTLVTLRMSKMDVHPLFSTWVCWQNYHALRIVYNLNCWSASSKIVCDITTHKFLCFTNNLQAKYHSNHLFFKPNIQTVVLKNHSLPVPMLFFFLCIQTINFISNYFSPRNLTTGFRLRAWETLNPFV